MNPCHPAYVPVITHMQDLQREAAAARLATSAKPRRLLGALIRSTALHLRSTRTQVIRPKPGDATLVGLAIVKQHS